MTFLTSVQASNAAAGCWSSSGAVDAQCKLVQHTVLSSSLSPQEELLLYVLKETDLTNLGSHQSFTVVDIGCQ